MSPAKTTTLGSDTLEILHGLPLLYRFNGHAIKTLQRVHPKSVDDFFVPGKKRVKFLWNGKEFEMGEARYPLGPKPKDEPNPTLIVSAKGLTDKEKVDLAKWLAGS